MDGGGTTDTSVHPLAHIRRSRGWSYQELARVVADNARALGVPMAARREKVWRWEHWGVVPEPDSQRALARALGVPQRELDARPWPGWLPVPGRLPEGLRWTPEGTLVALRSLLGEAAQDAREYPPAAGQALREAMAVPDWAEPRVPEPRVPEPRVPEPGAPAPSPEESGASARAHDEDGATAGAGTADWLRAGVLGLRQLGDRLGGAVVRDRVEADLRIVADLLQRDGPREESARPLHQVAAELARLGGAAAFEAGRNGSAQRLLLTGLRAAHSAGDRSAAAGILAELSRQALLDGRPGDALAAVRAADAAAGVAARGRVPALLAVRRARVLAALRDEKGFRGALGRAEELLGTAADGEDPSWACSFDAAELHAEAGAALLDLGHPQEALEQLERALADLDPGRRAERALLWAAVATARLRAGDAEGADESAAQATRLCDDGATARLRDAVEALKSELRKASDDLGAADGTEDCADEPLPA
ncbi:hypothetical protein [Wenjunlia tyrosinilytica]|uniref:Tetratricopeptide repeat protein n=1 Tax=Wenjunlia tyrosinilytica TaxID=1544741 RepID=A0A917ZMV0_9ACTN|nr:hypothetical protein [Wenjunlia tyrosinilytica]GGO85410.1 hypothetical protein GCM10012280_19120 [Wenjunlia tyrosinilytica]